MTSAIRRLLPHPVASCIIAAVWLALNSSVAPVHLAAAAVLGVALPLVLGHLLDDPVHLHRPWTAVRLALVVVWDIVVANLAVARRVLGPLGRLRPGFVVVPLDPTTHPDAAALLASIIALTPGTVSADIDEARTRILVHVLDLEDPTALVAGIKHRYERPLNEVFGW
jgi:multicomponent K+:H+ antiporter subunit E